MGKVLIAVLFLVVGLVIGGVVGLFGLGAATGVGVATGLSAGICGTVQAAVAEDLLTAEEVDQVMTRAAAELARAAGSTPGEEITGTLAQCEGVLERLRAAQDGSGS